MSLGICSRPDANSDSTAYTSPYQWSHLSWSGDRVAYYLDGQAASRLGVDVSSHQGFIDWSSVAEDGIDFAMVRIGYRGYTEGELFTDEYALYNVDAAQGAGLDVGAYFFSQATSAQEAREEAQHVIDVLDGRTLELPVAFDHEPITTGAAGRANNIDSATLTAAAQSFCETLESAGYQTMIYGNQQDMARFVDLDGSARSAEALSAALGGRAVWFAAYSETAPDAPFDVVMWQYTNAGNVAGIDTAVDLNILLPATT